MEKVGIKKGFSVTLKSYAEMHQIADEGYGGELIFDKITLPFSRFSSLDETRPYKVVESEDGLIELEGLKGWWPVEAVTAVYDGRVLLRSMLPEAYIGGDEDDADLFALVLAMPHRSVATLGLVAEDMTLGKVELYLSSEHQRLINAETGKPIRTLSEYRNTPGGYILGRHAQLQAIVTPSSMKDDPAGVAEANIALDLGFCSIEEAWLHFSTPRMVLEALRICSIYHTAA